jgi:hypothetical protein
MSENFIIEKREHDHCALLSKNGETIASLNVKDWDTMFFKRKFGILNPYLRNLLRLDYDGINYVLDNLLSFADKNQFRLVEIHCPVTAIKLIHLLEEKNFRMVDTRITFITLLKKLGLKKLASNIGTIMLATKDDLDQILHLTHQSFTHNPFFISRYKNKRYFTGEEIERYYTAWIENHIEEKNTIFGCLKNVDKVIGYNIYKLKGLHNEKHLYKTILVAVDPDYRGQQAQMFMESTLLNYIPEDEFYIDDTTQLTTTAAIKNHIKSQKTLHNISLFFYRSAE